MDDKTKINRRVLPFSIKKDLWLLIQQHCHKVEEQPGRAEYDKPWSDILIWREAVKTISPIITIHHVKGVRKENVGDLAPAKGGTPGKRVVHQVLDLSLRLNALEEWATRHKHDPFVRPPLQLDI